MYWLRRFVALAALIVTLSFVAWATPRLLDPSERGPTRRAQDRVWVNSSPYFWDRQLCRWISLCGIHHLRRDPALRGGDDDDEWRDLRKRDFPGWEADEEPRVDFKRSPRERRRILKDIPDYVTRHAPLVHLYSGEEFWPSDIREHVEHMSVLVDDEAVNATDDEWTLHNLHLLNMRQGHLVLHSEDDVESRPGWLHSHLNKPNPYADEDGPEHKDPPILDHNKPPVMHDEPTTWFDVDKDHPLHRISDPRHRKVNPHRKQQTPLRNTKRGHKPDSNGYSNAPAILVVVDKGSGIVDAFWFFFYSYNLGQTVLGLRFGNHVGDWEHCMMRFEHGEPKGLFFSEHEGGQAYAWQAVEKRGDRPVIYSAVGSHALYAMPGTHPYVLPFQLLKDITDKGPIWDPALNNYAYHFDYTVGDDNDTEEEFSSISEPRGLIAASKNPQAPTSWFHYRGKWGDQVYTLADPRQWRLFGQYHYVTGPGGPRFKALNRTQLCPSEKCNLLYELDPKATWY